MSSSAKSRSIVLRFDMRSAQQCPDTQSDRYRAAIDMAAWSDTHSIDVVGLSEHHQTEDGFLNAPLGLAGMMVARTQRVRISVSALLVPLHEPIRLAEEIALLDLVSQGRFSATCGLGYRQEEYDLLNVDWSQRGAIFDEKLSILVSALKGDTFYYHGKQTSLKPTPISPIQALLTIGGNSKAAARRAARFGLVFCPAIDDPELEKEYLSTCEKNGVGFAMTVFPREPATIFLSENPQASWKKIGEYLLYDALAYGAWHHANRRAYAESFAKNLEELIDEGKYRIITPDQALETIEKTGSLHLAPLCGGVPLEAAWETVKLFEDKVQPFL